MRVLRCFHIGGVNGPSRRIDALSQYLIWRIIGLRKSVSLNKALLGLLIIVAPEILGTEMSPARVVLLYSGDDSLDFSFKEGLVPDHCSLIVKLILFNKFLNDGHELVLIGLCFLEIFLHE